MSSVRRISVASGVTPLRRQGGVFRATSASYIEEAERLLERSRQEPNLVEQITWSYRAALRGAGAAIEDARTGRRRKSVGSAWSRLRSAVPELAGWADRFDVYARFVSRVEMGLETGVQEVDGQHLYQDACDFLDDVRGRVGYLPEVA